MPKNLLVTLFFVLTTVAHSQERSERIFGKVADDSTSVKDVHIFNISSRKGTISNAYGEFSIPVKENDTLLISDIQYESQQIIIDQSHLKNLQISIFLKSKVNELSVVEIKEHELTGNLSNDANNARTESKLSKVLQGADAYKPDMRIVDDIDQMDMEKAPDSRKLTDPTEQATQGNILGLLAGLGVRAIVEGVSMIGQKKRAKKKALINYEIAAGLAPDKIRAEFGDLFFTTTLKIPPQHIDGFILHCREKGIIDVYLDESKLEVIDLLIKESKPYLKKLKDEK